MKLVQPTSLQVEVPEECNDYYMLMKGREGIHTARRNATLHWVELVWNSDREKFDHLRWQKDAWYSSRQRYQRINSDKERQRTNGKFKERELM